MDIVWDDETIFKLIEIFETKSILWDSSNKHYKNNIKKSEAWEDISVALGISMQDAKSKIHRLRSQFAREKKKIISSITTGVGTAHAKKSKWKFYEALKFLSDVTTTQIIEQNFKTTSDSESDALNETAVPFSFATDVYECTHTSSYYLFKKMDIVWDDETIFKLIEIFETKRILWDSSSKHYKNNIDKREAWEDISEALGISMQDAKSKINRLRSQFARENKKILSSITTGVGTAHAKKSKWKFYEALKFLSDVTTTQIIEQNIKTSGSESDTMNETTIEDDVQETEQPSKDATMSSPQPQSTQQAPSSSQKTGKRKIDDNLNDLFITVKSAKEKMVEFRDEYDIYGQYVASELRAARNENAVLQAKSYINNILIDMRMGKYNHRLRISKS